MDFFLLRLFGRTVFPQIHVYCNDVNDHNYTQHYTGDRKNPQHTVVTVRLGGDVKNADLFADFRLLQD